MKILSCLLLLALALAAPARPDAQEIEASIAAPPAKAAPGRAAPPGAPRLTFRKRRVGAESDPRLRAILDRIGRGGRYPRLARRAGAEGAATVRFRILPNGEPGGLAIKRTSGNALLDAAALEAVRRAAPLPYLDRTLVLTIRYRLRRAAP